GPVTRLAFTADGRTLVSGGEGTLRAWDVATGRHRSELTGRRRYAGPFALTPDGNSVLYGATDGLIHRHDLASGAERRPLRPDVGQLLDGASGTWFAGLALSADGRSATSLTAVNRPLRPDL